MSPSRPALNRQPNLLRVDRHIVDHERGRNGRSFNAIELDAYRLALECGEIEAALMVVSLDATRSQKFSVTLVAAAGTVNTINSVLVESADHVGHAGTAV